MNAIRRRRVHVAQRIAMNTIRETSVTIGEDLTILQSLAIFGELVAVDVGRTGGVVLAGKSMNASVGHIDVLPVV